MLFCFNLREIPQPLRGAIRRQKQIVSFRYHSIPYSPGAEGKHCAPLLTALFGYPVYCSGLYARSVAWREHRCGDHIYDMATKWVLNDGGWVCRTCTHTGLAGSTCTHAAVDHHTSWEGGGGGTLCKIWVSCAFWNFVFAVCVSSVVDHHRLGSPHYVVELRSSIFADMWVQYSIVPKTN